MDGRGARPGRMDGHHRAAAARLATTMHTRHDITAPRHRRVIIFHAFPSNYLTSQPPRERRRSNTHAEVIDLPILRSGPAPLDLRARVDQRRPARVRGAPESHP